MKLDNVRLLVTNFDECLHFYNHILGFRLTWGEPGGNYASFDAGNGKALGIFKKELMTDAIGTTDLPAQSEGQDKFACVFKVTDLAQTVNDIEKRGGKCCTSIENNPLWGIRTVHLRDPDGNLIELFTKMPKEEWDGSLVTEDEKYQEL